MQLRLTLHTGQRSRTLVLPPIALAILAGLLPLAGILLLGASGYFIFHDDLLADLTQRQNAMQSSYEDRLARLRHEILSLTQRANINEAELAERLDALARQQGQLENRNFLVASLIQRVKVLQVSGDKETGAVQPKAAADANPLLSGAFAPSLPSEASAYLPLDSFAASSIPASRAKPRWDEPKPQPEGFELRLNDSSEHDHHAKSDAATAVRSESVQPQMSPLSLVPDLPLSMKFDRLAARQKSLDHAQLALLNDVQRPAKRMAARLRAAFRSAGLTADQLTQPLDHDSFGLTQSKAMSLIDFKSVERDAGGKPGSSFPQPALSEAHPRGTADVGGPFVPLPPTSRDEEAFARAAAEAQDAIATAEKLHRIAAHVPFAAPLPGQLEVTSTFGPRIDPFLGRPALHTGVDLRDDYGAPVRATAAGTVIFAKADGGYGNLVEIDHGNSLSTRYAHLSSFAVSQGQKVEAGSIIGHIGETGRATGPHLHYETRIDGEPVDPERFLKAGLFLRTAQAEPVP